MVFVATSLSGSSNSVCGTRVYFCQNQGTSSFKIFWLNLGNYVPARFLAVGLRTLRPALLLS
jgi:hypothetical protein